MWRQTFRDPARCSCDFLNNLFGCASSPEQKLIGLKCVKKNSERARCYFQCVTEETRRLWICISSDLIFALTLCLLCILLPHFFHNSLSHCGMSSPILGQTCASSLCDRHINQAVIQVIVRQEMMASFFTC